MRFLIIAQKVDVSDDNLSFFHRILEKFSEKLDKVYAVCLSEGESHLADNVEVFSLGKEKGCGKLSQLIKLQKILLSYLPETDGVYCHMGPIFAIAAFPLVKLFRQKLILWYVHRHVSWQLKLAEKLVDAIATSSSAGCRLKSKKVKVLGQGIDIEKFKAQNPKSNSKFAILYAARLVPVKGHKTLIEAINILVNQKNIKNLKVKILGNPLLDSQKEYLEQLKKMVEDFGLDEHIEFKPGVPYSEMPEQFWQADLFVNPSNTGSLDKVVLEAMASGCLVLTCNEAYKEILEGKYMFRMGDAENLAVKIADLMTAPKDENLRDIVVKNHNLDDLTAKIIRQFCSQNIQFAVE